MKQKIVIDLTMNDDKSRKKAFKIAVGYSGVINVTVGEKDNNKLVVTGDGVDAAELTNKLKKKMKYAQLESVSAVEERREETEEDNNKVKNEGENPEAEPVIQNYNWPPVPYGRIYYEVPAYNQEPCQCSIM